MSTAAPMIETEVVESDDTKEVALVVQQTAVQEDAAKSLQASFSPLFKQARDLITQSKAIVVTDANQAAQIKLSRAYRLQLRKVRIDGENLRKSMKEESLKRGKAIDAFNTILLHLIESEEKRLDDQEKIIERQEAARKEATKAERIKALAPYGVDTKFIALEDMPDETFAQLLENSRVAHEAKIAEARRAEEERIRKENERLKEEARIREENARLKKEAEAREAAAMAERDRLEAAAAEERRKAAVAAEVARLEAARLKAEADAKLTEEKRIADEAARAAAEKARKERKAAEAKAKAERDALEARQLAEKAEWEAKRKAEQDAAFAAAEAQRARVAAEKAELERKASEDRAAREKAEAEARAIKDAADKKAADEAEATRQAALAPDKEKLLACANALRAVGIPALLTDEGRGVTSLLFSKIEKLAAWLEQEASVL